MSGSRSRPGRSAACGVRQFAVSNDQTFRSESPPILKSAGASDVAGCVARVTGATGAAPEFPEADAPVSIRRRSPMSAVGSCTSIPQVVFLVPKGFLPVPHVPSRHLSLHLQCVSDGLWWATWTVESVTMTPQLNECHLWGWFFGRIVVLVQHGQAMLHPPRQFLQRSRSGLQLNQGRQERVRKLRILTTPRAVQTYKSELLSSTPRNNASLKRSWSRLVRLHLRKYCTWSPNTKSVFLNALPVCRWCGVNPSGPTWKNV